MIVVEQRQDRHGPWSFKAFAERVLLHDLCIFTVLPDYTADLGGTRPFVQNSEAVRQALRHAFDHAVWTVKINEVYGPTVKGRERDSSRSRYIRL